MCFAQHPRSHVGPGVVGLVVLVAEPVFGRRLFEEFQFPATAGGSRPASGASAKTVSRPNLRPTILIAAGTHRENGIGGVDLWQIPQASRMPPIFVREED